MDTRKLRYFLAVADAGSFVRASSELRIAQPALSQQISNLETELGAQLFHRSHRGVELTAAGKLLKQHATAIMASMRRAKEEIARLSADMDSRAMITMPPSLSKLLSFELMSAVAREMPSVHLSILDSTASLERDLFLNGHIAFGLLFKPFDHRDVESVPLLGEPLCMVIRAEEGAGERAVPLRSLDGAPLILPARPNGMRDRIDDAFSEAGLALTIDREFNSLTTICNAVEIGGLPTILPYSLVAEPVAAGRLVASSITEPEIRHTIYLGLSNLVPWRPLDREILRLTVEVVEAIVTSGRWPGASLDQDGRLKVISSEKWQATR